VTDERRSDSLELAPERAPIEQQDKGFWKKLKKGLFMTHTEFLERLDAAVTGGGVVNEETLEHLEETLIGTDLGVETSLELMETLKDAVRGREVANVQKLQKRLVDQMTALLMETPTSNLPLGQGKPVVTLMVGVNGVGKTTSAAKLAKWSMERGDKVMLAAADTFRAAAVEQLTLWGERLGVDVIKQVSGADPGAVVFDALQAAKARGVEHVIKRVIDRQSEDWQRWTLLVLDATTGQNAVSQAREFTKVVDVDGLLLAKIDGTAKGGVVVAVARDLNLPVMFLGVGETAEDLIEFRPREFAAALLG
jgi:fused signal recognition particle receptor